MEEHFAFCHDTGKFTLVMRRSTASPLPGRPNFRAASSVASAPYYLRMPET
jgi:hypothetical protein